LIVVTDLEKWKLHGPVAAMQSEHAEWDRERQGWHAARLYTRVIFDRRGRITQLDQPGTEESVHRTIFLYDDKGRLAEVNATVGASAHWTTEYSYDAAGRLERAVAAHGSESARTITVCAYDASGRKQKTEFLPTEPSDIPMTCGVDGSEIGYGVPGAATITTMYDERERPVEAVFHDATHALLRTVTFTRDTTGRVVTEDARMAPAGPYHFKDGPDDISPDDRAQFAAMIGAALGSIITTFTYDSDGQLIERRRRMGTLSDQSTTFTYDHHGNSVHERTERRDREMRLDENGGMQTITDSVRTHESRVEYTYDSVGNWTERVVWARFDSHPEFQRTNVERRTIEYHKD
jgi:YD repeat-containing protein